MDSNHHGPGSNTGGKSVCRYFATRGECFYGDSCQYLHQSPPGQGSKSSSTSSRGGDVPVSQLPYESKLTKYMHHHQSGAATNGDDGSMEGFSSRSSTGLNNGRSPIRQQHAEMNSSSNSHVLGPGTGIPATLNGGGATVHPGMMNVATHQQLPVPVPSYFISDDPKLEILRKQTIALTPGDPELYQDLPLQVENNYHDLVPLEDHNGTQSTTFGCVTSVYKATSLKSGEVFCLRRVHNYQVNANTKSLMSTIQEWKKLQNANIVPLRQVFTTKAFGDLSLVFVYEFFPGAQTLNGQYFASQISQGIGSSMNGLQVSAARPYSQQQKHQRKLLPETLIWTYIIQLSSALRTIHSTGLSCRAFDPSKIILTNGFLSDPSNITQQQLAQQQLQQPRLRLSGCAVFDIVSHETFLKDAQQCGSAKTLISHFQQDDLLALGKVCLALACNSLSVVKRDNWPASLELVSRNYSSDLRLLICHLLSVSRNSPNQRSINDIMPMIGARFYTQLDLSYQRYDLLEDELVKEVDNSRLFRMLSKLGSINERSTFRMDPQWSETGDRYLLKLFRDYLFHQVCEDGRPWLDMGHIVSTLNKLDTASPEKLCLVSRDEQNVLIVSFAELKKCFDSAFSELLL